MPVTLLAGKNIYVLQNDIFLCIKSTGYIMNLPAGKFN